MTVTTFVDRAERRVENEQDAVSAKRDAFEQFHDRVSSLPTAPAAPAGGMTATVGTQLQNGRTADDRCRTVRNAFAETIRPHSCDGDEPLLETIRNEFTDQIAVALASTTETGFSSELKGAILGETERRRAEIDAMSRALDTETAHLDTAGETVEEITDWFTETNEVPLTELGFDALQQRHETLAAHRERCDELAQDRQTLLDGTTSQRLDAGIRHRQLVSYLYEEFPVDNPVVATAVRLDELCASAQRTVRDHLVRRV
ncbi:MAG: DUF7260 family protein [Halovenus sp.]